jgi:hypothetical protein
MTRIAVILSVSIIVLLVYWLIHTRPPTCSVSLLDSGVSLRSCGGSLSRIAVRINSRTTVFVGEVSTSERVLQLPDTDNPPVNVRRIDVTGLKDGLPFKESFVFQRRYIRAPEVGADN